MTAPNQSGRGPPGQPLRHQGQDTGSRRALAPFSMNTVAPFSVDTRTRPRKDDVWLAWQSLDVLPKPQAPPVQRGPHKALGCSVFSLHS